MSDFDWARFDILFSLPDASEKFNEILINAKEEKLTLLNKLLRHLNNNEPPEKRDTCVLSIIKGILKLTIHPYGVTSDGLIELMNCLVTEARHFSTEVLTKTVSFCLEFMEHTPNMELPIRWIQIFGKMVAVLTTRDEIDFNDDIIDGKVFKNQVIISICRVPWGSSNAASVVSVLGEIPGIDLSELDIILDKASTSLTDIKPAAVPQFALHLLNLAGERRSSSVIYHFDKYFESIKFGSTSGTGDTTDTKRKALGSTVYFFIQAARNCETMIKELVKRVKASSYDYQLVITPFTLSVSLGLTSIDHIRPTIVDSLKNTIVKSFVDINLSADSAWYNRVRGNVRDSVSDCFISVMNANSSELDFMLDGMKELAMGLLNVELLQGKDPFAAEKCKDLGIYLITSIVKRNREYLPSIINELLKNQQLPFIECLASCLKSFVRTIVKSSYLNRIFQLISHLPRMTVETASRLIKALLPALQLSPVLMSEMLMVLRKTIWKSVEARRISLTAMVLMLENSRIIGNIPSSQYSAGSETFFTQASQTQIDVFGSNQSNEPLCFEIISILKRFFSQQLEVKDHLYLELHNVVRKNPELIGIVCCQLLTHVKTYTNSNRELSLEKVLDYSDVRDLKLKESLGLLIQCLCSIVLRGQSVFRDDPDGRPHSLSSCENFLDKFKTQLLIHGMEYYETEATKHSSESSQGPLDFWDVRNARNTLINEILGALEAFIEFTSLGGKIGQGSSVRKLYQKYRQLKTAVEKPAPKQKGAAKKKKVARQNQNTQPDARSQGNTRTQPEMDGTQQDNTSAASSSVITQQAEKTKVKLDTHTNKKKFMYHHIMNLESVREILKDFYGPVENGTPLSRVQGNVDFEKYLLAIVSQKLGKLKQKETLKERKRKVNEFNNTLACIAAVLWEVCQTTSNPTPQMDETTDPDEPTIITQTDNTELRLNRLEIISVLMDFLHTKYPSYRITALNTFNSSPYPNQTYEEMFSEFFEVWKKVFKLCVDSIGEDRSLTAELHNLFAILDTFCKTLKPESLQAVEVKQWCDTFIKKNPRSLEPTSPLLESFLKPYITSGTKSCRIPRHFIELARQAHFVLEDLDNETAKFAPEDGQMSWLIQNSTATSIITTFGQYVGNCIKFITEVLGRLKAHSSYIDIEKLGNWRDESCIMLEFLLKLSTELVRSEFSSGPCGDILLKIMSQFFITMTNLTGDMIEVHNKNKVDFSSKRYEHLVRLIGKDFKVRVEALITHVELIGKEEYAKSKKPKATASLKLKFMKDARSIPDLVYNMEKYERKVISLSKKTKVNLLMGTKLSTARDFRIQMTEIPSQVPVPPTRNNTTRQNVSRSRSSSAARGSRSKSGSRPPVPAVVPSAPALPQRGSGTQTARRSRGKSLGAHRRVTNEIERENGYQSLAPESTFVDSQLNSQTGRPLGPKIASTVLLNYVPTSAISEFPLSRKNVGVPRPQQYSPSLLDQEREPDVLVVEEIASNNEPINITKCINRKQKEAVGSQNIMPPSQTSLKRAGMPAPSAVISQKRQKKLGGKPLKTSTPMQATILNKNSVKLGVSSINQKGSVSSSHAGTFPSFSTLPSPITINVESGCEVDLDPVYMPSPAFTPDIPCSVPEEDPYDFESPGTRTVVPNTPTGLTGNTMKPAMRHLGLKRKRT